MRLVQGGQYKCIIKFRKGEHNDCLDGMSMLMTPKYIMRDDDEYPGEYVMVPVFAIDYNVIASHGLTYLPSGNLKFS